jgi:hypothetical protein
LLSAEEAKARLREIVEGFFFRRLKGEDGKHIRRLLVRSPPGLGKTREAIGNKRVRCALTGEKEGERLPVSARFAEFNIAHFGNIRGTDEFKGHEVVIILGRDQPSVRAAERRAMAIWYDTKKSIQCLEAGHMQYPYRERHYTTRDEGRPHVRVRVHPDPRVQAVVEQVREAEMVQAIDRLRLIHSPRKKIVVILCNIPLGIPVDELVTWRELVGDGRLAQALEACEKNGWEALPWPRKN